MPQNSLFAKRKKCKTCDNVKEISQFRKRVNKKTNRIGYEPYCRVCESKKDNERLKLRSKKLIKENPNFKIKKNISYLIWENLKKNNSNKKNQSIIKFLPYTVEELKQHLESQFEPWMNWSNYGSYKKDFWKEEDVFTWTWQIDHIVTQSCLPYKSMEEENFKQCWSLNNLRPLSSKQNNLDGVKKTRHYSNNVTYK